MKWMLIKADERKATAGNVRSASKNYLAELRKFIDYIMKKKQICCGFDQFCWIHIVSESQVRKAECDSNMDFAKPRKNIDVYRRRKNIVVEKKPHF